MNSNLVIIIGTKAQLIKMAPVIKELMRQKIAFKFVWTGQHQETINELLKCFGIPQPDFIWVPNTEADTKFKLFRWLFAVFIKGLKPNQALWKKETIVIVHGDTLSAFVGALIAKIKKAKVLHIEAGLRSFNLFNPFPEEILRVLTSYLTTFFACSSEWACKNAKRFSKNDHYILNTYHNTLLDSTLLALQAECKRVLPTEKYCVVSIHRVENLNNAQRFDFILNQILSIALKIKVIFVLHPTTKKKLEGTEWLRTLKQHSNILLEERMDYIDFCHLLNGSSFLISDGGSNQEECSYLKLPCMLMRKATEREEGLDALTELSYYKAEKVDVFVNVYSNKARLMLRPGEVSLAKHISPSKIIVDFLVKHNAL